MTELLGFVSLAALAVVSTAFNLRIRALSERCGAAEAALEALIEAHLGEKVHGTVLNELPRVSPASADDDKHAQQLTHKLAQWRLTSRR